MSDKPKTKRKRHVVIYRDHAKQRSRRICDAWERALRARHVSYAVADGPGFDGRTVGDIAIFYGLRQGLQDVFNRYGQDRMALYVDLGYWQRKPIHDPFGGYHKVAINALHPTAYFRRGHPADRLHQTGPRVKPWRGTGDHIIVAGMSDKSAEVNGYQPEEWERWAIDKLSQHTDRRIIYRPKPSWKDARPITGARFDQAGTDIRPHLQNVWAVVTHHSNAAVDAIVEGIPTYCQAGVGSLLSIPDLSAIEQNVEPPDREGFLADLAYTQWSVAEMESGACWDYLRAEGLV